MVNKKTEDTIKKILTVIGWIIIVFAVIALISFILKSGS